MPTSAVLAAERGVILQSFGGSRAAYVNALQQAHASVSVARGILGDQLRRARVQSTLPGGAPTAAQIQTFYESYPDLSARLITSKPQPSWLGSKAQGFAISEVAPDRIFTMKSGRATVLQTSEGSFRVKALDDALPLGAVPLRKATPAIAAALRGVRARRGVRELDRRRSSATCSTRRSARATTSRSRVRST